MKRVLVAGAAAALLAAPSALGATPVGGAKTMHGTVVAKDRAHRGLVVAAPNGAVRTVTAPGAFAKTDVGRRVVVRYRLTGTGLPVALGVRRGREAGSAVIRGTIIRIRSGRAVLSAGGSALSVSLAAPKRQRALSSAASGPGAGDEVKVEVEIDDDGSLDATEVVVTGTGTGTVAPGAAVEGRLEVRGTVTAVSPAVIVKTGTGVPVTCLIPAGGTAGSIAVGDLVELKCDLVGGQWTLRKARGEGDDEGDNEGDDEEHRDGSHAADVKVSGTLTSLDPLTVTPGAGAGTAVTCVVPAGVSLAGVATGQVVEMTCRTINGVPTLERLKAGGSDDDHEDDEHDDDSGGNDD